MKLIENYNKALEEIYEHVGFVEDYVVYPLCDETESYWFVDDDEDYVTYGDSIEQLNSDGNYYQCDIYKQRFYNKWVYEGTELTMIFADTNTDGMKYFMLFDNNKKVKL